MFGCQKPSDNIFCEMVYQNKIYLDELSDTPTHMVSTLFCVECIRIDSRDQCSTHCMDAISSESISIAQSVSHTLGNKLYTCLKIVNLT